MTITNKTASKLLVAFVAVAMLCTLAFAPVAKAATDAELQAQITALLAQIAALQGTTGTTTTTQASYMFTRDLTVGSVGEDVRQLQMFLNNNGYAVAVAGVGSKGMESTTFGPLTRAALGRYQAAKGVTPAVGYFGPITRAAVNAQMGTSTSTSTTTTTTTGGTTLPAGCTSTAGYSSTTGVKCTTTTTTTTTTTSTSGPLEGGAGSADYTLMSALTNEEVGEDEEDVEVAGLEVEADGSDLELTAVRIVFDEGTAGSDFEDYAEEVSIWLDGEEVGREDGEEFNDNNDWSKTVSLDSAIIREGDVGELVIAVSAVGNLDTNDATDTWTVDFRSVRYEDAQGASISEDPGTAVRTFSFESFATASDAELKISEATKDKLVNDGHMINVHATSVESDEAIFSFTLEASGDSDLTIETFGVNVDVTGALNVDDVISGGATPAMFLELDGEEYGTAAYFDDADGVDVLADEDVRFTDVDFTLESGDSITGQIIIDLLALSGDIDTGDTIQVTLGETESDQATLIDVEDESGTALVDADITGSAASDAHEVRDVGFVFKLVSTSASITAGTATTPDIGTYTQKFTATAFDGDVALDKTCEENGAQGVSATEGVSVIATNPANHDVVCSLSTTDAISSTVSGNSWLIPSGATRTFTITTAVTPTADTFAKTYIEALGWDVDANAADTLLYLTAGLGEDNTSTSEIFLNDSP